MTEQIKKSARTLRVRGTSAAATKDCGLEEHQVLAPGLHLQGTVGLLGKEASRGQSLPRGNFLARPREGQYLQGTHSACSCRFTWLPRKGACGEQICGVACPLLHLRDQLCQSDWV